MIEQEIVRGLLEQNIRDNERIERLDVELGVPWCRVMRRIAFKEIVLWYTYKFSGWN